MLYRDHLLRHHFFFRFFRHDLRFAEGIIPDSDLGSLECLHDIQNEKMERTAVDLHESEGNHEKKNKNAGGQKKRKIKNLIKNRHYHQTAQNNDKLPGRNRADDLVFNVNELWDGELLHVVSD